MAGEDGEDALMGLVGAVKLLPGGKTDKKYQQEGFRECDREEKTWEQKKYLQPQVRRSGARLDVCRASQAPKLRVMIQLPNEV
jgi:hypothetical protein